MRRTALPLLVSLFVPGLALAQRSDDTLSLAGKNIISLGFGLTGARDATATGTQSSTHATGELGYIGYAHYVHPQAAVEINVGVLSTDTFEQAGRSHANTITPVLFGVRYSPEPVALTRSLRPFLSLGAGPYVHTVADASDFGTVSSTTETAAGARLGAGIDWYVARHFMLRAEGDYHAVGSFEHPDALTENASGFGFGFGMGFVWGGR
jgi:outer membrane protein with beta-barrel domain